MNTKRLLSILVTVFVTSLFAISSYAQFSGKTENFSIDKKDFSAIVASSFYNVEVTVADTYSISVTCSQELKENLDIYINHGTLYLDIKTSIWKSYKDAVAEVRITMPSLESLNLSGSTRFSAVGTFVNVGKSFVLSTSGSSKVTALDVEGHEIKVNMSGASEVSSIFKADEIEMELSGSSEITSKVVAKELDIENSAATRVEVYGRSEELYIESSGASSLYAFKLEASRVKVDMSGTCKAEVFAADYLEVELSGISSLLYKDDGELDLNTKEIGRGSKLKKVND